MRAQQSTCFQPVLFCRWVAGCRCRHLLYRHQRCLQWSRCGARHPDATIYMPEAALAVVRGKW